MPTYFVAPDMVHDGRVVVTGDLYRHLAGALRVRPGEALTLVAGDRVLAARVASAAAGRLTCEVTHEAPVPPDPARVTLAVGLPKGRKLDDIVRRAVELGATGIVPLRTGRSVPRPDAGTRRGRLAAIALEAAQQSGRFRVPDVDDVVAFADFAARPPEGLGVVLWEGERDVGLLELLAVRPPAVTLVVGPEGGLHPDEVALLVRRGYRPARLAAPVLRSETACLAALAVTAAALWRTPGTAAAALTARGEGL